MLNSIAIKPEIAPPKDGTFDFMISDLEAMFPDEMVDPVYKELPQWEETVEGCTNRFLNLVKTLADKYPSKNLLLVTHGSHGCQWKSGVLFTLFRFAEQFSDASTCIEALQELKGYVIKKMGGCDKQGFPMKQGVLAQGCVCLLLH